MHGWRRYSVTSEENQQGGEKKNAAFDWLIPQPERRNFVVIARIRFSFQLLV